MTGKIVKALSGFYYVKADGGAVYECKAKGAFRNEKITPLVGDNVTFDVISEFNKSGNVTGISPRKNELIRPAVANVDQAMVIFSIREPHPNLSILDRFLVLMRKQGLETIIVFNKKDLAKGDDIKNLKKTYKNAGCKLYFVAAGSDRPGTFFLKWKLRNKTTVMAGPSGAGKSTLVNTLAYGGNSEQAAVGEISKKIGRGKHTTRHTEIFNIGKSIKIVDTPGFTSLLVDDTILSGAELADTFPEFNEYKGQCRFSDCSHIKTKECAVEKAVNDGKIPLSRYNSYKSIYESLNASKGRKR